MDNRKEYSLVFRKIEYTNKEKLALLDKLIANQPPTDDLLQYYADRAQVHYDMQQYQAAINDIYSIEQLREIADNLKALKWKSLIHLNFDTLRGTLENLLSVGGHNPCQTKLLKQISEANVAKFLEDGKIKRCKRKRNED